MTSVINLILLVLRTAGALAACGGETWRRSDEPLDRRTTHRGGLFIGMGFHVLGAAALASGISASASGGVSMERVPALRHLKTLEQQWLECPA
jgi:hypothetical protein